MALLLLAACGSVLALSVNEKVDSLFVIASSGELKYREMVEPAIDSLAAMEAAAVPRLVEKYSSKDARERHTIDRILEKIGREAVPHLIQSLTLDDPEMLSRICYTLGQIKDSMAVDGIIGVSDHADWRVRSSAAGALGKIGDSKANSAVMECLADPVETVRKSAAVASGRLAIEEAIPILVHMLGDLFYGARMTAAEALAGFGELAIAPIADSLNSKNLLVGDLGCITLGIIGGDTAAEKIAAQLQSPSVLRRSLAAEAIFLSNSSYGCGFVEVHKETEIDPTVLFFINRVIDKYATR